jgi:hypothetical protein
MMTDCVDTEIYCGERRPREFDVVAFGTVIVKRALAFGDDGPDGDAVAIGAAVLNPIGVEAPPPEQLQRPTSASVERTRLCMDVLLTEWGSTPS